MGGSAVGNIYADVSDVFVRMIMAVIETVIICKIVGKKKALFITLLYYINGYDRYHILMLTALILAVPAILEKPNRWLQIWLMGTFFAGLYYPLSGVALLIGGLPFGIAQAFKLIKNKEILPLLRKPSFYISWGLCIAIIIPFIPLLLRMAKHMSISSSQSVIHDKLMIFTQDVPADFMKFINNQNVKKVFWFGLKYALEVLGILMFVVVLWTYLRHKGSSLKEKLLSFSFNIWVCPVRFGRGVRLSQRNVMTV
jgi:ABC-type uncharacterized transport system fused permease/ATPase subunit